MGGKSLKKVQVAIRNKVKAPLPTIKEKWKLLCPNFGNIEATIKCELREFGETSKVLKLRCDSSSFRNT